MAANLNGKVILITGASDGIGKAAAATLKAQGATVVIIGRSAEKTKAVAASLHTPYYVADFAKLQDVRDLAKEIKKNHPRIDVLVNNAGGIFGQREETMDGFEKTLQVNHLAHFLLTQLLLKTLIASKATIINTSSVANKLFAKFDINDLNVHTSYSANKAYGNAKLENILFTKELDQRYRAKGIAAVAFHPGIVATSFASSSNSLLRLMYQTPLRRFAGLVSPEKGADTLVWLASTKPGTDWQPGQYYVKRKSAKTNPITNDPEVAKALWEQSEKLIQQSESIIE